MHNVVRWKNWANDILISDLILEDRPSISEGINDSGGYRFFRTVLNTLAASENLSVLSFSLPENIEKKKSLEFFLQEKASFKESEVEDLFYSHSDPFWHTLRSNSTFGTRELSFLVSNFRGVQAGELFEIDYGNTFSNSVKAYGYYHEKLRRVLVFGPSFVNHLSDESKSIIPQNMLKFVDEDNLPLHRLERLRNSQEVTIAADVLARSKRIVSTLDILLNAEITKSSLQADFVEELSLIISYLRYHRTDFEKNSPMQFRFSETQYEDDEQHLAICKVEFIDEKIAIKISQSDKGQELPLFINNSSLSGKNTRRWSKFQSDYNGFRNKFFLERIMLLRLWFQDKLRGVSLKSDSANMKIEIIDSLAEKINEIFDADGCHLYKYRTASFLDYDIEGEERSTDSVEHGRLELIGRAFEPGYSPDGLNGEPEMVSSIYSDMSKRSLSASYKAVDKGDISFKGFVKYGQVVTKVSAVPRTVLVAPLISRGRIWGVIEVFGRNTFQFPQLTKRWLNEIVRVITPILYDQWLLYDLWQIGHIVTQDMSLDEKYIKILHHSRKIMLASSARLYLRDKRQTKIFMMRAHSGLAWPSNCALDVHIDDPESISAIAIKKKLEWSYAETNSHQGRSESRSNTSTLPLFEAGHTQLASLPIRDAEGNTFGDIVFTSKENYPFNDSWGPLVETLSQQLAAALSAVYLIEKEVERKFEIAAHSLKNRAQKLNSGLTDILRKLNPLLGSQEALDFMIKFTNEVESVNSRVKGQGLSVDSLRQLQKLRLIFPRPETSENKNVWNIPKNIGDMKEHLSYLYKTAVFLAGGRDANDPNEVDPKNWDGTPADIRACLLTAIHQTITLTQDQKGLAPHRQIIDYGNKYRIPSPILTEIFNNLIDNALKYDFRPNSVQIYVPQRSKSFEIEFRNLAPQITSQTASSILKGGIRGPYAEERDKFGTGIGLEFCIKEAERWGIDLIYNPPITRNYRKNNLGVHSIKLLFSPAHLKKKTRS